MKRAERLWLIANFIVGVPFCIVWFVYAWRHELQLYTPDTFTVTMGFVGHAIWSFVITLYVFGIPSRIAINLLIKERRACCQRETVMLVIAFLALSWMFYAQFAYPPEG